MPWNLAAYDTASAKRRAPPRAAYRLRHWPELACAWRTAGVYRALSRMSVGPVSHDWFARTSGLSRRATAHLLDALVEAGDVHRIELVQPVAAAPETDEHEGTPSWWQRLAGPH